MSDDSLLGMQLDEYRLEVLLGRGGMARVYRGLDTGLNRYVAVKVIDTPHRSDEAYVKRFKIEAQAIARLDHPQVVRLYRYGEANGLLYMAMQYIEGADLSFLLNSYRLDGEFMPSADVLRLVTEICQALDYIHTHGIIHRDIKPSNIMLTRDEARVVLTDFGLALRAEQGTRGQVFGSPHYIAPEQAISSARSVPQSDLYSLGVILYEMFTRQLPFDAADPLDIAVMHMNNQPPPPRAFRPELSAEVEAVILHALEKQPEDRYQSGRALALALERALRGQPGADLPTHRTIPERVTIGLSANPLPALPPISATVTPPAPQPAAVENMAEAPPTLAPPATMQFLPGEAPQDPPAPPAVPPSAQDPSTTSARSAPPPVSLAPPSGQPRKKPAPWLLGGAAVLATLCLLTCLAAGGVWWLLRDGSQGSTPQAQATRQPSAVAGLSTQTPQATPSAAATIPTADYQLKFWRCDNEGCLVIENTGSEAFPLQDLTVEGKEGSLDEDVWAIDSLKPGQCVKLVKSEEWITRMPAGISCEMVEYQLVREKKDLFWNNAFTVLFDDQQVGECEKKKAWCEVLIPRE